jgi:arylsulfatase A-like enzyme
MYPPETVEPPAVPKDERILGARRGASMDIPADKAKEALAAYHASITFMDAQLGLILDAMDRRRLWDTTVVVFLGDNGFHAGEHGLWGKMALYEESARVPLVLAAPGLGRPGAPTTRLVELLDVYPTLLELCRLPPVEGVQGRSLAPLVRDPEGGGKTAAFTMRKVGATRKGHLAQSVRTERYRYTEWPEGTPELFDHAMDPGELTNLAGNPGSAATISEMKALLGKPR